VLRLTISVAFRCGFRRLGVQKYGDFFYLQVFEKNFLKNFCWFEVPGWHLCVWGCKGNAVRCICKLSKKFFFGRLALAERLSVVGVSVTGRKGTESASDLPRI
jgi:hypothetical protein